MAEPELNAEDRAIGSQSWQLIAQWPKWTKRRVESITYETASSIRRHVSVDLRLKSELFTEPVTRWGETPMHYVPVAQLRKRRLVRFDLRDEEDRALPLITKRKNAAISAGMLTTFAQVLIARRVNAQDAGFTITQPANIRIPATLERDFSLLGLWEPERGPANAGSLSIIARYQRAALEQQAAQASGGGGPGLDVAAWEWTLSEELASTPAGMDDQWRAVLGSHPGFVALAYDIARLYLIYAPLRHMPGERRIVKFGYSEYLGDGQPTVGRPVKSGAAKLGLARAWNRLEDRVERLPRAEPQNPDEWIPPLGTETSPTVKTRRRLLEALGWATRLGKFETPGMNSGASYHLEISTPVGIQIRRAQLVSTAANGRTHRFAAQRGARTLRAVGLYTSGTSARAGNAFVNMRAESSLIIRAAALSSIFVAAVLTVLWAEGSRVTGAKGAHADAVAAALVVIPGLLTVLSTRDAEHPLATSMVFGLRVLAFTPGLLAFLAAGEILFGSAKSTFGLALFICAWVVVSILLIAWRLASRGHPHPDALAPASGGEGP